MDLPPLAAVVTAASLADFTAAADRIRSDAIRTPLLPHSHGSRSIRLKAECLQPFGSFKIRCATNALAMLDADATRQGVATASAGNFAQGLALAAKRRGIALTVHVPDNAAAVKIAAIRSLGATIVPHPFTDWWQIMSTRQTGAPDGVFIHPVCEAAVILGNGSIGLELAEDWPQLDTVVIPIGGGGLASGIALALRALQRKVRIVACEIETAAPLAAAFKAGAPVRIEREPSFVDGIGSNSVLAEMWPLLKSLVDEVIVVSLKDAEAMVRELAFRHHLVAEGAGATALAAAMSARCGGNNVAAIISGGNLDSARLCAILES